MSVYRPIIQVIVEHQYFAPAPWTEYRLEPTPATREFLFRHGFRWVSEGTTSTLYADSERLSSAVSRPAILAGMPNVLCFSLATQWEGFGWVTPLPGTGSDTVLVYVASVGGTEQGAVEAAGPVVARVRSLSFAMRITPPTSRRGAPRVFDVAGRTVEASARRDSDRWHLELPERGPGYYRVVPDGGPESWILAEPGIAARHPLLVLAVHGWEKNLVASISAGQPPTLVRLEFPTRATVWRYHVFNAGAHPEGYRVESATASDGSDRGVGPRFRRVPGLRHLGGESSLSFESEAGRPIPLRYRPPERFRLVLNGGVVLHPLPTPGPALAPARAGRPACSEMMVHL